MRGTFFFINLELCEQTLQIHSCKCHSRRISWEIRAVVFPAGFKVARLESRSSCGVRDKSVLCIFYKPGRKVLTPVYFGKRRIRTKRTRERLNRGAIFRQFRVITFACEIAIIRFPDEHVGRFMLCKGQPLPYFLPLISLFLSSPSLFSSFRISGNGHYVLWGQFSLFFFFLSFWDTSSCLLPNPISFLSTTIRSMLVFTYSYLLQPQTCNYKCHLFSSRSSVFINMCYVAILIWMHLFHLRSSLFKKIEYFITW